MTQIIKRHKKTRFDFNFLKNYCEENKIELLDDYSEKKINRETIIYANCINEDCSNTVNKTFRNMIELSGCYCPECTKIQRYAKVKKTCLDKYGVSNVSKLDSIKEKKEKTSIENFGVKYALQLPEFKENTKKVCLERYGVEYSLQSKSIREKIKKTNIERYGFEHPTMNNDIKDKIKNIFIEKYGVKSPLMNNDIKNKIRQTVLNKYGVKYVGQSNEIKEKMKKTCLEKYGVEYSLQSEIVREKSKKTNFINLGVNYSGQSEKIKEKIKQTNLKKYNVPYTFQSQIVKDKAKKTILEKYGVEYISQSPEIAQKQKINSYRKKIYKLPSGKELDVQGYEPYALNEIIQSIHEDDIIIGTLNVPVITYNDENNKIHKHFPDIFIPSLNKLIEIKSTWTAKTNLHNIFLKQTAAKKAGYLYEIWIYTNKGKKVECHI
jgi:hypothetical protein